MSDQYYPDDRTIAFCAYAHWLKHGRLPDGTSKSSGLPNNSYGWVTITRNYNKRGTSLGKILASYHPSYRPTRNLTLKRPNKQEAAALIKKFHDAEGRVPNLSDSDTHLPENHVKWPTILNWIRDELNTKPTSLLEEHGYIIEKKGSGNLHAVDLLEVWRMASLQRPDEIVTAADIRKLLVRTGLISEHFPGWEYAFVENRIKGLCSVFSNYTNPPNSMYSFYQSMIDAELFPDPRQHSVSAANKAYSRDYREEPLHGRDIYRVAYDMMITRERKLKWEKLRTVLFREGIVHRDFPRTLHKAIEEGYVADLEAFTPSDFNDPISDKNIFIALNLLVKQGHQWVRNAKALPPDLFMMKAPPPWQCSEPSP